MAETLTSVLTKPGELARFLELVTEKTGDPSAAVCQVFVPWYSISDELGDLVPDFDPVTRKLQFAINEGISSPVFSLPISDDGPQIGEEGIEAFGLRKVCARVMHAFVVFHGVPEPAPWERMILLVSA